MVVRIDWDALIRGWPIDDEVCEIAGVGPVSLSAVRAMIDSGDAWLAAVVTKGVDVANVVHLGRKPIVYQGTALDWLQPTCANEACTSPHVQTDHREDWVRTKVTFLAWLDHLCPHDHRLKTRFGRSLVPGTGKRAFVPPDDPRHPAYGARDGPTQAA